MCYAVRLFIMICTNERFVVVESLLCKDREDIRKVHPTNAQWKQKYTQQNAVAPFWYLSLSFFPPCCSYRSGRIDWPASAKKQINFHCFWKHTHLRLHQCLSSADERIVTFARARFWTALGTCPPHNCCAHTLPIAANWKEGVYVQALRLEQIVFWDIGRGDLSFRN